MYAFSPLPTPTSVRLLELKGYDGNNTLLLSLRTADLHDGIPYDALSYTWGDPFVTLGPIDPSSEYAQTVPAICDGQVLHLQRNLAEALQQLQTSRDINKKWRKFGWTALHVQAHRGSERAVKMLIRKGADISIRDFFGRTAVFCAVTQGSLGVLKLLIDVGADPNITDNNGMTPLAFAQYLGQREAEDYLLKLREQLKSRECGHQTFESDETCQPVDDRSAYQALLEKQASPGVQRAQAEHKTSPYYLWVDAICINQSDLDECAAQVTIMSEIYSRADTVISWLGREEDDTHLAVDFVENLSALNNDGPEHGILQPERPGGLSERTRDYLESIPTTVYTAYRRLMSRRYFNRAWILQEIALPKECIMQVGPHEIQLESLRDVANLGYWLLEKEGQTRVTKLLVPFARIAGDNIPVSRLYQLVSIVDYRARFVGEEAGGEVTLSELLYDVLFYEASDPRDKIYSVLGMIRPKPSLPPIEPNYAKSPTDVYVEATLHIIWEQNSLDALALVRDKPQRPFSGALAPPSWTASFTQTGDSLRIIPLPGQTATPDSRPLLLPSPSARILAFRAHLTDHIAELSPPQIDPIFILRYDHSVLPIAARLPPRYPRTHYPRGEALARTLTGNRADEASWDAYPAGAAALLASARETFAFGVCLEAHLAPRTGGDRAETMRRLVAELDAFAAQDGGGAIPRAEVRAFSARECRCDDGADRGEDGTGEDAECRIVKEITSAFAGGEFRTYGTAGAFMTQAMRACAGRRIFRTEGGFLGLAPGDATVGDGVWLVPGAAVSLIFKEIRDEDGEEGREERSGDSEDGRDGGLEKKREKYEVVGHCFVLGYMDGEMYRPEEMELRDIELA